MSNKGPHVLSQTQLMPWKRAKVVGIDSNRTRFDVEKAPWRVSPLQSLNTTAALPTRLCRTIPERIFEDTHNRE